jgi:phage baseplate assembly protein W
MKANVGFSSQHVSSGFDTRLSGSALIKMDLENHFSISKGEVRGRPKWGTNVRAYLGRPFTSFVVDEFRQEVQSVIDADPRVEAKNTEVSSTTDMISFTSVLRFVETGIEEIISVSIDANGIVSIR